MITGLLLAAGAGRRLGTPKALVRRAGEAWLQRSVQVLQDGGCDRVIVVLGAAADEAEALLTGYEVEVVRAQEWRDGMGASLRTGLQAVATTDADAALVHLVDLPDVTSTVVARVLAVADGTGDLARAAYDGVPGHPVLLGRDHWEPVLVAATGDRGARDYLSDRAPTYVECGDLATGHDVDHAE